METEPRDGPTRPKRKTTQKHFLLTAKRLVSVISFHKSLNNEETVIRIYPLIVTLNKLVINSTSSEDCPGKQGSNMNLRKLQIFPVCKQPPECPETHQHLYCFIRVICSMSCRWFCCFDPRQAHWSLPHQRPRRAD